MSQNVIEVIEGVFNKLVRSIEEDEVDRILSVERHIKIDQEYLPEAFDVVSKANVQIIKSNDSQNIFSVSYNDDKYVVLPEQYSQILDIIDLTEVENVGIQQGIGILAMNSDNFLLKEGISSLDIIDQCLEIKPENGKDYVEFTYGQICGFFEVFFVAKFENSNFKVIYSEDFLRMYGISLTLTTNKLLSEKTHEDLRELLFLESSRSIASSIINVIQSGMNEHKFLQLYQCIEYLFIIYNAIEISSKYEIDKSIAVEMIINESFKVAEISNVVSIIGKSASETSIINYYDNIISRESCENTSDRVSNHIYKIRCNVAHLRYKQENVLENINWKEVMEHLTHIVLSVYQKMDVDIVLLCKETNSWLIL